MLTLPCLSKQNQPHAPALCAPPLHALVVGIQNVHGVNGDHYEGGGESLEFLRDENPRRVPESAKCKSPRAASMHRGSTACICQTLLITRIVYADAHSLCGVLSSHQIRSSGADMGHTATRRQQRNAAAVMRGDLR